MVITSVVKNKKGILLPKRSGQLVKKHISIDYDAIYKAILCTSY